MGSHGQHNLRLPFVYISCTSWSRSRQDWNGFSSKSVTCSPPPDITTMQRRKWLPTQWKSRKFETHLPTAPSCTWSCVVGAARLPGVRVDHLSSWICARTRSFPLLLRYFQRLSHRHSHRNPNWNWKNDPDYSPFPASPSSRTSHKPSFLWRKNWSSLAWWSFGQDWFLILII